MSQSDNENMQNEHVEPELSVGESRTGILGSIKKIQDGKRKKTDKKLLFIIITAAVGVMLLIASSFGENDSESSSVGSEQKQSESASFLSSDEIEIQLESRLKSMVQSVKGAGTAQVMITLDSAGEYVYAADSKSEKSSDKTSDEKQIIIRETDGGDSALVVSIKSPKVRGVAVVCDGGDNALVKAEITSLVTDLFGIGAQCVYVGAK